MESKLAASLSLFAARFSNELANGKSSICSPLSAEAVLALTVLASSGDTRAELLRAMGVPDDDAIRSMFAYVTSHLKSIEGITLNMANRVYVTKKGTLKPSIKKDAEEVFDSGLEQLDFEEPEAAAGIVNKWVAEQTNNMITKVVNPSMLNRATRVLLVNAIYFQGFWSSPFKTGSTKNRPFHVDNNEEIKVPMMYKSSITMKYKHSTELKAQFLEMDYKRGQASMVVILPDEVEGLGGVLQQLAAGHDLEAELAGMKNTLMEIKIPKFKVETEIDLKELLPKLGIKTMFSEEFSSIRMLTLDERQCVSQAIQKAVIEVDEAGTKAVAATFGCYQRLCMISIPEKKQLFIADRPFLYLLKAGQLPLFVGVYRGSEFAVDGQPDGQPVAVVQYEMCCSLRRPKKQRFIADRPFLYLLRAGQLPLFVGVYRGSEFAVEEQPERQTVAVDEQIA